MTTKVFRITKLVEAPKVGECEVCHSNIWNVNGCWVLDDNLTTATICEECECFWCEDCLCGYGDSCPNKECSLFASLQPSISETQCPKCKEIVIMTPECEESCCVMCMTLFEPVSGKVGKLITL